MLSILDAVGLVSLPEGVAPGSDTGSVVMGRVTGVDAVARAVQVTVLGSEPVWVPALPAIYTIGGMVRLLRSPLDGGKVTACLGPQDQVMPLVKGVVTAVNTAAGTLTVTTLGASYVLPFNASTYSVGQSVHVLRDAANFGAPYLVAGPVGNYAAPDPGAGGGGSQNPGQTENRQVTVGPQWSGSWTGSGWDKWNVNRPDYGGRAALYQGQGYGSPPMQGLAVYGDQVVNLQAQAITKMTVHLIRVPNGSGGGTGPAVLQGSPNGGATPGGGPGGSGATVSVGIARGTEVDVDLPSSMFEGFRTGGFKGLALVGSSYLNLYGADRASAMALTIQYAVVR